MSYRVVDLFYYLDDTLHPNLCIGLWKLGEDGCSVLVDVEGGAPLHPLQPRPDRLVPPRHLLRQVGRLDVLLEIKGYQLINVVNEMNYTMNQISITIKLCVSSSHLRLLDVSRHPLHDKLLVAVPLLFCVLR